MALHLNCRYLEGFVPEADLEKIAPEVRAAHDFLYENRAQAAGNAYHEVREIL